jgi:hypothetical protein
MSSSGIVRSLTRANTPPFAFPAFCRKIRRVLDHEQGPRGNSERRGAGLALSPATVDRLIRRGVNAIGISPGLAVRGLRAARRHDSADGAARDDDDGGPRAMRTLCESIKEALRAVTRSGRALRRLPRDWRRCVTMGG